MAVKTETDTDRELSQGAVLLVDHPFSALSPLSGQQEGLPACKTVLQQSQMVFVWRSLAVKG